MKLTSFVIIFFLEPDKEIWNTFIDQLPSNQNSFYQSYWLYSECYMYRKVSSFFENTSTMKSFDYFTKQKQQSLKPDEVESVAKVVRQTEKNFTAFDYLFKVNR